MSISGVASAQLGTGGVWEMLARFVEGLANERSLLWHTWVQRKSQEAAVTDRIPSRSSVLLPSYAGLNLRHP